MRALSLTLLVVGSSLLGMSLRSLEQDFFAGLVVGAAMVLVAVKMWAG